jgi:ion channel POLLUX/CASTOR
MKRASNQQKIRYWFDNLMSKGTSALIGILAIASVILILIISFFAWITKSNPDKGFLQIIWMSLMRTLDAGTMGGDEGSILFLFSMFGVTLGGIFIISLLIGILTTGIEGKIESLRKGRSLVLEKGHTVILGWSEQIFTILSELIEANANQRQGVIVIMGQMDKVEMEDMIKERMKLRKNARIICRQGNPLEINDLDMVNINSSRSIILLEEEDSEVIKIVLAIVNNTNRRKDPYHIVAMLDRPENLEVGKIAGGSEVEFILSKDIIARLTAQTCLQPGLSLVYNELLDFGGDEIYLADCRALAGKTFKQSLLMYEDSAIIGLSTGGKVCINPPMDTLIKVNDKVIAISADDDTVVISEKTEKYVMENAIALSPLKEILDSHKNQDKVLILGFNENAETIIRELDNYVAEGSLVTLSAEFKGNKADLEEKCSKDLKNINLECFESDINDRVVLDGLAEKGYSHIVILSYHDLEIQKADAKTLITLLHLRDISRKKNISFSLISEMQDIKNRALAEIAQVNDFIVSNRLLSLLMAQISENKLLNLVFTDLFDAEGSEIYLKEAAKYVNIPEPVNFYTVVEAAARHGEVAIGYKLLKKEKNAEENYGIHVNPVKSEIINFSSGDSIIVIAQD